MTTSTARALQDVRLQLHDLPTPVTDQVAELTEGLRAARKVVSPKYFYDDRGSRLFDRITRLKEYYPTRTEHQILSRYAVQMCQHMTDDTIIVEPGSGSSDKIRFLLDAGPAARYAPIEISKACLVDTAAMLADDYPALAVHAICADFTTLTTLPEALAEGPKTAFFPGSTIGNFEPEHATQLLQNIHTMIGRGNRLLIGVDLLKPIHVLHAAYNDQQGVTAQFNLNLLTHIGRVLGCEFNPELFAHQAFFNPELSRIEMHLQCLESHVVQIGSNEIAFRKGETIHTENSYKYSIEQFEALAEGAGFKREHSWLDDNRLFSVHGFVAV